MHKYAKGKCGTRLEVSKFVESGSHMGISVEESEKSVLEFREFLLIRKSIIILKVVVQQMNGLRFEKCSNFWVVMNDVAKVDLVNIGIESSIPDSGPEEHPRKNGQSFESKGQVPELIKEDGE